MRDWINVISLLYEKTLKTSMVGKKNDQKEAAELQKIYKHYPNKRKEIMKNTQFEIEDIFGDIINKDTISPEQIIKIVNFLAKLM